MEFISSIRITICQLFNSTIPNIGSSGLNVNLDVNGHTDTGREYWLGHGPDAIPLALQGRIYPAAGMVKLTRAMPIIAELGRQREEKRRETEDSICYHMGRAERLLKGEGYDNIAGDAREFAIWLSLGFQYVLETAGVYLGEDGARNFVQSVMA